jgi:hypothetical protein
VDGSQLRMPEAQDTYYIRDRRPRYMIHKREREDQDASMRTKINRRRMTKEETL